MIDFDLIIDRIQAKRESMGLSQRALAKQVGVSFEYINKIECDRRFPSISLLFKIADVLDMTAEDVFLGVDTEGAFYMVPDICDMYSQWDSKTQAMFIKHAESLNSLDGALKKTRPNKTCKKLL